MAIILNNKKERFGAGSDVSQNLQELKIRDIIQDIRLQPRQSLNIETINDYAEKMQTGISFPPIIVFHVESKYYVADGFHRINAALKVNLTYLSAEVKIGTFRDAVLFSVSANSSHGLNRTSEDKRKAVVTLLNDAEWNAWSNNAIAKKCQVSLDLVNRMRNEIKASLNDSLSENQNNQNQIRTYINKSGNIATINTANIGKKIKRNEEKGQNGKLSSELHKLEKKAVETSKRIAKQNEILMNLEKEQASYYDQIIELKGRSYLNKFIQTTIGKKKKK